MVRAHKKAFAGQAGGSPAQAAMVRWSGMTAPAPYCPSIVQYRQPGRGTARPACFKPWFCGAVLKLSQSVKFSKKPKNLKDTPIEMGG